MFKMGCQKCFTKLQKMKSTPSEINSINWKKTWNNVFFWVLRLQAKFQARKSENDK